ncbi:hypothetical protein SUDANB99_00501 [Streptomyces sp. enrichment culture]
MGAAGPQVAMTALALNISGLYLGTGVAGALGGTIISIADIGWVPVVATVRMGLSFLLTPRPVTEERPSGRSEPQPADA